MMPPPSSQPTLLAVRFRAAGTAVVFILGGLLLWFAPETRLDEAVNHRDLAQSYASLWSGREDSSVRFLELLLRQPASPYRWADLAESSFQQGDSATSEYAIAKAVFFGRHIPVVMLRAMNLAWASGDEGKALSYSQRVLGLTAQYDAIVFSMYDRMSLPVAQILDGWEPSDSRSARSYLGHLLRSSQSADVLLALWNWLSARGAIDESLAQVFFERLLALGRYSDAIQAWIPYARRFQPDYSATNLIFNGDFGRPVSGVPFDWRIDPAEQITAGQSHGDGNAGSAALEIAFNDGGRTAYQNVSQLVPVTKPGLYEFSAAVRTESLECDEGVRFRVYDIETPSRLMISTPHAVGTGVTTLRSLVSVPPTTKLLQVQVIRNPSACPVQNVRVFINQVRLTPK